ncbi:MAG TPA: tetratricopeptide repeat protein [Thermoanaerobaculia bacterium]
MTDGSMPDRLAQLRGRWEADPASRIFLQLAEEYRHQGRLHEALGVLDEGLKEHPGYLSALVAKGRCLLELGQPEPAREVLERVVRQDATQMVANKLLVRTYLETGQAARARERLDLYSLLHDGDPEVEDLRARIQRLDGASAAASHAAAAPERADPDPSSASPQTMANMDPTSQDDVFDLGAPTAAPSPKAEDVFELPHPAAGQAAAPAAPAAAASAPAAMATPAPPPDENEPEPVAPGEPFAGLVSPAVRRRYLEALAAEGIFAFELPAAWAPAAPAPTSAAPPIAAPSAPEPALEPPVAVSSEPPAPTEPAATAAPTAPAATADWPAGSGVATVTLGELYLRQGHAGEAERIFGEVLGREPDNAAAHEGLERARGLSSPVPAPPATPIPAPAGRRTKTIHMLNGYLDRIRGRSARHVS